MTGEAPTTPTATDKLEEVRKLNVEIAKLVAIKDTAASAALEAQKSAQEANERAIALKAALNDFDASRKALVADITTFTAGCTVTLAGAIDSMRKASAATKELSVEADRLIGEIATARTELQRIRDDASRENAVISQNRDDLDVYRDRIVKAAGEVLPDMKLRL